MKLFPVVSTSRKVSSRDVLYEVLRADASLSLAAPKSKPMDLRVLAAALSLGPVLLTVYNALKDFKLPGLTDLEADAEQADKDTKELDSGLSSITQTIKKTFDDLVGKSKEETPAPVIASSTPVPTPSVAVYTAPLAKPSAEVDYALKLQAKKNNVDYNLLYSLAGAESSFNPRAKASTSSASGLMQFTEGTWTGLVKKYNLPYTLEDRHDPHKAAEVSALYTKEIRRALSSVVPNPTSGDIYLGYFLGPGSAAKFLRAYQKDPQAKGASLFPAAAKANKSLFFSKSGEALTLGETYSKLTGKVQAYYVASTGNAGTQANPQVQSDEATKDNKQVTAQVVPQPSVKVGPAPGKSTPVDVAVSVTEPKPVAEDEQGVKVASTQNKQLPMSSKAPPQEKNYVRTKAGVLVSLPA